MNVLLLTDKLVTGGAEVYFCKLENNLQNINGQLYTAAAKGELYSHIVRKECFITLSRSNHLSNLSKLCKIVKTNQIHLIHANSLRMLLYSLAIKQMTKRDFKFIYTKHNVTILEKRAPVLFKNIMNRYVDVIITVSDFERENLLSLGIDEKKVQTIYNGVDIKQFAFQPIRKKDKYRIGILARLSKEKNHTFFIKIANELRNAEDCMFYIAGDGPERENISNKIQEYNLQHKVKMLGNIANPYEFICSVDLLILTSIREIFPMVVIEAMSAGTPIMAVDVGGVREAVKNDETGILIPQYCEREFAQKIKRLRENQPMVELLKMKAREKVETSFSVNHMIEATFRTYELVNKRS
ncbi:glycosyltransferase family 4 protein [Bacillus rhizoplanae]|uniref:glycosyltransferase family 4 protein n=1 Tax=Bacillus rhizoplanae TaxID=2880966 RepID=UPI003D1F7598